MKEIWRKVEGYPEYDVSNLGRVRSYKNNRWGLRESQKILSSGLSSNGRCTVSIGVRNIAVHVLVLEAFIGACPYGMEGCHRDDNPLNNRLDNLRWDTHSANIQDAIRNGRQLGRAGRFTDADVLCIRNRAKHEKQRDIASDYGCLEGTISAIVHRRNYRRVP